MQGKVQEHWSSRWTFLFAAIGAAVGLGNIWKFPYITGKQGGGLFVLTYLLCILLVGIPILIAELYIGKIGQSDPVASMRHMARKAKASDAWGFFGFVGVVAGFLVLSYYAVIAGWTLIYLVQAIMGDFQHITATQINAHFTNMMASPGEMILAQFVILLLVIVTILRGVKRGIEAVVKLMCPLMVLVLCVLIFYSYRLGDFGQAVHFLFYPNFSKISADTFLVALGHAFFSLSLALGTMMIYGAYLPKNASVVKAGVIVALADTAFALMAGLAIFPIVLANPSVSVAEGSGLVFKSMPLMFSHMPYGEIFSVLFFLLLFVAAFTSAISLLEPSIVWLMRVYSRTRNQATMIAGVVIFLLGIPTILSFNHWKDAKLFGHHFFGLIDYVTANVMMPFIGLGLALFMGYVVSKQIPEEEFGAPWVYKCWVWSLRTVTPLAVLGIFYHAIF